MQVDARNAEVTHKIPSAPQRYFMTYSGGGDEEATRDLLMRVGRWPQSRLRRTRSAPRKR